MNIPMNVYNHFRGVAKKKNNFVMAAILDFQNFAFSENATMGLLSMLSFFTSNLNYSNLKESYKPYLSEYTWFSGLPLIILSKNRKIYAYPYEKLQKKIENQFYFVYRTLEFRIH